MPSETLTAAEFRSVDPARGVLVRTWPETPPERVEAALVAAREAQGRWATLSFEERAVPWRAAADLLEQQKEPLARLMAEEMGKPLPQGRAEIEKCAWACRHFAEHAAGYLAREPVETSAGRSFVVHRPLGTVLAVMPWNFPFWQVFRFAAPTLMAGNAGLLKHAPNVQGCAEATEGLLRDAGLPAGLFANLRVDTDTVAELIARPEVAAVTLTGSTRAGRAVGAAAGAALKPSVLELGGSDPYVVLADADVERAAAACVASRLLNSGQSCIAAKRFIVVPQVARAFTAQVVERMAAARMGPPLDQPDVDLGPLARADLREQLHDQVVRSRAAGARVLLGGERPAGPGSFYPPTVLADVGPDCPAYSEETFGPVASIVPARDEEDALRIANDTSFGLGGAVFTRDVARGERLAAERLEAGCCAVNDFVRSDPRLPFGGIRESGYGRELAAHGIRAFVNVKAVSVRP